MDFHDEEQLITERWTKAMRAGNFLEAWRESELALTLRRFSSTHMPENRSNWLRDVWNGTSIDGRKLLVRCNHGFSDTIQFIRYCNPARQRASKVIVKAQPELLPLLKTVSGIDDCIPQWQPDPLYDVDVEIREFPFIERTTIHTIPSRIPYIHVPEDNVSEMGKICEPLEGLKIGICWSVGPLCPEQAIPFSFLSRLQHVEGIHLFSLQKNAAVYEVFSLGSEAPNTLTDTAALIKNLDLVITVDTAVAHLAGALGTPVWTLLHYFCDWRWMQDRKDSPWYPTMQLFRQERPGDWESVIDRVLLELLAMK